MANVIDTLPKDLARERVLSSAEAAQFIGLGIDRFRQLYRLGKAPKPILIGERKFGWKLGTLIDWVDERAAKSNIARAQTGGRQ
jgi:predicted DNA-binding transcriptional regulator AlpA